ncbi:MAG: FtsX-like permease family protein [Cyclobacteriaceae bacterium]
MWPNYFISAIRHWRKNSIYVTLNILSLSAGIALSLLAVLNANFNLTFNQFFEDADRIYRVISIADGANRGDKIGEVPLAVADRADDQLAGVEGSTKYVNGRHTFRVGEQVFAENVGFVDDQFLKVFQYPGSWGSVDHDISINGVALSNEVALKWMGTTDCVGQTVQLIDRDGQAQNLQIENVLDPTPDNTSFRFACLMSYDHIEKMYQPIERPLIDGFFVKVEQGIAEADIEQSLNALFSDQPQLLADYSISSFQLVAVTDWPHQESQIKRSGFMPGLHPASVLGTFATAISILLLSCFNYVNTSISTTQKRLKEMAVRKVMGAGNGQLLAQWWLENYLTVFVAMLLGCFLAYSLIPSYNAMLELSIISIEFIPLWQLLAIFIGLWLTIGLFCGFYPALLVSKFSALDAIYKRVKLKSNGAVAKVFIALQFAMTVYTLYCLFVFLENGQYVSNLDRGYEIEEVINIPLNDSDQFRKLHDKLSTQTSLKSISGTMDAIGFNSSETTLTYQEMDHEVIRLSVGDRYLETIGLRLAIGESFNRNSWERNEVIINEMTAELLGVDPLNTALMLDGRPMRIIGIVEDFAHRPIMLGNKLRPVVLTAAAEDDYRYLSLRAADGSNMTGLDHEVAGLWYGLFPNQLYTGFMQQDVLKPINMTTSITLTINMISAILSVLISMIGLYSLMSLHIQKHLKEFGVRKILGASVSQIAIMINREMALYFFIAAIAGVIASDLVVNKVLDIIYSYHISTDVYHWVLPVIFMTVMVLITVGRLVWQAARINPVHHLRYE